MPGPEKNAHDKLAALLKKQNEQENERDVLQKKITELKLTFETLESSIATTKLEYARTYNQNIPLILGLPTEITHIIFSRASRNEPLAEIKLSHVCHKWRSIALSYPDIWSRIVHVFSDGTQMAEASQCSRLSAYLERSGVCLLLLRFEIYTLEWCDNLTPMLFKFLRMAREHASRWRRFSMEMIPPEAPFGTDWDNQEFLALFDHWFSAPNLELFEVVLPSSPHLVPLRNLKSLLHHSFPGDTPKLAFVRMDSLSFMRCAPPLFNITTLQLENRVQRRAKMSFQIFLDILNTTSSTLVNLLIGKSVFDSKFNDPSIPRASAKQLKNFLCGDQDVAESLWLVNAPVLELLIFRDVWFDSSVESSGQALNNETNAYFPSLKTLAFVDCFLDVPMDHDNFPLARVTSHITQLHIYGGVIGRRPLLFGMALANPTTLWPDMEKLSCTLSERGAPTEKDYTLFTEMVLTRSKILQKHCILRISAADEARWASAHSQSWEALRGYIEAVTLDLGRRNGDVLECVPWPNVNSQPFWERS